MTYALGGVAGLILGLVIGYLKNLLLWKKYFRSENAPDADAGRVGDLYMRSMISFAVNVGAMALAFFTRELLPFDGIAYLVGTAAGLVVMNKALVFSQKKREARDAEKKEA